MKNLKYLLFLLLILAIFSCQSPYSLPPGMSREQLKSHRGIIDNFIQKNAQLNSISGLMTMNITIDGSSHRLKCAIVADRSGGLRLEFMTFFGKTLASFVATDDTITYINFAEKTYFTSSVSEAKKMALISSDFPPVELFRFLTGTIAEGDWQEKRMYHRDIKNTLFFQKQTENSKETISFNKSKNCLIDRYIFTLTDDLLMKVSYDKFRRNDPFILPSRIKIRFFKQAESYVISWKKINVNPHINSDLFQLAIPPDFQEISAPTYDSEIIR